MVEEGYAKQTQNTYRWAELCNKEKYAKGTGTKLLLSMTLTE